MSKLKQMIVSAFAVCALAVGVGINPVTAYAEDSAVIPEVSAEIETSEEVIEDSESVENSEDIEAKEENENVPNGVVEKTDDSKFFEKTIKPFLIEYGAAILAFSTVAFIAFRKIKKVYKTFKEAVNAVKESYEENVKLKQEVKQLKEENEAWKKSVEENLVKGVNDTNLTVHKILDVEKIAYEENPTLVSNGTAKKIAEVINESKH